MSLSSLWVLVDVDVLACFTAGVLVVVAVGVRIVAAETANQIYASGPSAHGPGASSEVEQSPGAYPPRVSGDCWAAGADAVFPSHASPGGPTPT